MSFISYSLGCVVCVARGSSSANENGAVVARCIAYPAVHELWMGRVCGAE